MAGAMGRRSGAKGKSPKADAAMAMLAESMPMPGMPGEEMEVAAEAEEMPAPGGGEDFIVAAQGLLENWPDKEHPYYKDLEALIAEYSA
jgi:hypothetical protein